MGIFQKHLGIVANGIHLWQWQRQFHFSVGGRWQIGVGWRLNVCSVGRGSVPRENSPKDFPLLGSEAKRWNLEERRDRGGDGRCGGADRDSCKCILLRMVKGRIHTKMVMANKRESVCVYQRAQHVLLPVGFSWKRGKHRYSGDDWEQ